MPVCDASRGIMGLKIVSAVPSNITTLLPTSLGCVQLYDFTGQLLCQMECGEITAKRTAVSSAVATELLASPQSKILAVLGAGVQAESHVWALRQLYDFSEVRAATIRTGRDYRGWRCLYYYISILFSIPMLPQYYSKRKLLTE